ncbi:VOC family protein [Comamonadaceae bacterium G21597-S1]|nr:VOC family protein [Comamonadaceae bacterium G21597-S1]
MPDSAIDHIAVTAPTLERGAAWVEQVLGVAPQPGGEHALMGTHNVLLRLGDDIYLEVIAANPRAAPPARPRWFGLDALEPDSAPRVRNWIARTADIGAALAAAGEKLGTVTEMQRGDLRWRITIPDDGKPLMGGTAPALIEWKTGPHPASRLPDQGVRLQALELFHPRPHRLMALLEAIGMDGPVRVRRSPEGEGSSLVAHIATPRGSCALSMPA